MSRFEAGGATHVGNVRRQNEDSPPQQACDLMVALTLDRGASDNVTAVVVLFDPAAPAPAGMAPEAAGRDIWE
jgi:serine/threonine protein phosphatase PrpC